MDDFDFGEITQEDASQPKTNWQVAYAEQLLDEGDGKARYAFFFHHLDLGKQLLTPFGPLALPNPKKVPRQLQSMPYEAP